MEQYTIKMENFEGPLDLLCHLIDKNKMDICEIKLQDITDQYLSYLDTMQEMNLEITSEFIVMAARLIYLKSKSLLPSITDAEEETEVDFIKMLVEYKKYKEYTITLREQLEQYGGRIAKSPETIVLPKGKLEKSYESELIPTMYSEFMRREKEKKNQNAENVNRLAMNEKVTVRSKIKEIIKTLLRKPSFIFNQLFDFQKRSKNEVVTAFLSLLELSKMSRIRVSQEELFGDIKVEKVHKEKNTR